MAAMEAASDSVWHRTIMSLVRLLYQSFPRVEAPPLKQPVIITCVSDTHCKTPEIPEGDIFLHAGDLSKVGSFDELQAQLNWINDLPHRHKIVLGGNHDFLLDPAFMEEFPERMIVKDRRSRQELNWRSIEYLQNSSTTVTVRGRHIKIFGCPLTPRSGHWAFQYPPAQDVWNDLIPPDTDVLLSHGPPQGHLDVYEFSRGCPWLLRELWKKRPRLVVFGHIHAGHGVERLDWSLEQKLYDQMVVGNVALVKLITLAALLLLVRIWSLFRRSNRRCLSTLINAAVVSGKGNIGSLPPTVVAI